MLPLNSLSEKFALNLGKSSDMQDLISFNEKSAKWHTLNTLMIIGNNKKIASLHHILDAERARLRFVEDKSEQLEQQVGALKFALLEAGGKLRNYHRNLLTVITLLKLTTLKPAKTTNSLVDRVKNILLSINFASVGHIVSQNAIGVLLSILLSRVFWIDSIIDGLGKLLFLLNLPKNSVNRTKLGMKISAIIFIFVMLRKRLQNTVTQFKAWVNFMF